MNVTRSVKITQEQNKFIENESINFSKFVRQAIDFEMNRCDTKSQVMLVTGEFGQ
jgi:hypothetical protein